MIVHFETGGAVAIHLASKSSNTDKICCLIIENSFTSIPDMAKQIIPWKGLKYLPLWFHKNKASLTTQFISNAN